MTTSFQSKVDRDAVGNSQRQSVSDEDGSIVLTAKDGESLRVQDPERMAADLKKARDAGIKHMKGKRFGRVMLWRAVIELEKPSMKVENRALWITVFTRGYVIQLTRGKKKV